MNRIFKIMLLGDVSTGKTSFLTQLAYQAPQKMPKSTTQWSFFTLRISSFQSVIQIWDTPGDQRNSMKSISILENFNVVLLFIDLTNEHTFNRAKIIMDQMKVYPDLRVHIILSKNDIIQKMPYKQKVSKQQVQKWVKNQECLILQYSPKQKIEQILEKVSALESNNNDKKGRGRTKSKDDRKIFNNNNNGSNKQKQNDQFCQCIIS